MVLSKKKKVEEEKYHISRKHGFVSLNFLSSYTLQLSRRSKQMFNLSWFYAMSWKNVLQEEDLSYNKQVCKSFKWL